MPTAPPDSFQVLTPQEKWVVGVIYAAIIGATATGFALLLWINARHTVPASAQSFALTWLALGVLTFTFGLRHGVDADHIAAIDNTTRKLLAERKRPLTVGTWFSLGHSTVVVGMIIGLVAATQSIYAAEPSLKAAGSIVGTLISGSFLWLIGLINLLVVIEVYRIFQRMKAGRSGEAELEAELNKRGFMSRYFNRLFKVIESPRQIYPVGILFGLGFDTATEVVLIAASVAVGVSNAIPVYYVLVLPLLFLCGMTLVDTTDGIVMRFAYGWAFLKPIRKIYYNLTVTVISILVAFAVGSVELLQVVSNEFGWRGGIWDYLNHGLSFQNLGFGIVALFIGAWLVSMAYYRFRGYDLLESSPPQDPHTGPASNP